MPLVLFVVFLLGGTLAPLAHAARTPLALQCAQHLREDVWGNESADLLQQWDGWMDSALAVPSPDRLRPTPSRVNLGWLSGKRKRAFVRQSDFADLTDGHSIALARHAHRLHHAVRWATPHDFPTVYGPDLVDKTLMSEFFLGPANESRWSSVSRSLERHNRLANRSVARMLASGAIGVLTACATFGCNVALSPQSASPWILVPGGLLSLSALIDAGRASWQTSREEAVLKELRAVRARLSGEALLRIDLDDGPFYGHDEARQFRDFARTSVAEWDGLREGDPSRWWFFSGTQGHEMVDVLIYSQADNADDLEVLTVVR